MTDAGDFLKTFYLIILSYCSVSNSAHILYFSLVLLNTFFKCYEILNISAVFSCFNFVTSHSLLLLYRLSLFLFFISIILKNPLQFGFNRLHFK